MPTFDFVNWGNTKQVAKWVIEGSPSPSGIFRGQCTQTVNQFLKDIGYSGWAAARGNGNQVGPYMVAHGEATYVGTNLASIPPGEIHVICKGVGQPGDGHVSVAGVGDIVFEQNTHQPGVATRDFGIGPTYPGRLGRLSEPWRGTRYHYKITVTSDYDNIGGDDDGSTPGDTTGENKNRFLKGKVIETKKRKSVSNSSVKNLKRYQAIKTTKHVNRNG